MRRDGPQFDRAASLGVYVSMSPFQYYWGDLLDGQGVRIPVRRTLAGLRRRRRLRRGGVLPQRRFGLAALADPEHRHRGHPAHPFRRGARRRTGDGTGCTALRAHTINAARTLYRDNLIGSITPGKLADFTELAADPVRRVDPARLAELATVNGTWLSGERIDIPRFLGAVGASDPGEHAYFASFKSHTGCC